MQTHPSCSLTCMPLPMEATSTCVSVALIAVPLSAARARACASAMAKTRSMPIDTPTAGTSLPLNMPTSLSYRPPARHST